MKKPDLYDFVGLIGIAGMFIGLYHYDWRIAAIVCGLIFFIIGLLGSRNTG